MNNEKPFKILGIQQIALGSENKESLKKLWCELFGLEIHSSYKSEKENVDEDILLLGEGKAVVEIDLMQPIDINKSPKVHIPPLNHIGLWVDDIEKAVEYLIKKGVRFAPGGTGPGGIRLGATGNKVCFIHPKGNDEFPISGSGVLIELVQAP